MLKPAATSAPRCARSARRAAIALHQDVEIASGLSRLDHTEGVLPSRHGQINGVIARDLNADPPHRSPRFRDLLLRRCDDVFGGEAELLLQLLKRRGGAERLHADAVTARADILRPAEG